MSANNATLNTINDKIENSMEEFFLNERGSIDSQDVIKKSSESVLTEIHDNFNNL